MARLIALVFLCLCGLARAQGTYYDAPSTSVPTPPFATYVHDTRLWIPNDVTVIRGVMVLANGANGDQRGRTAELDWQAFARAHGFALMGTHGYICYHSDAVVNAEVPVLLGDLAWYATASGHPEVANLPFILAGWSGGGQIANGINTKIPERVIAFIANKGSNYLAPSSAASLKTPGILVAGQLDGQVNRDGITNLFQNNRPSGALWADAFEWNTAHNEGNVDGVFFTFFDHAIRARYPAGATPLTGPVTLLDLPETSGWLATAPTFNNGLSGTVYPYAGYPGTKTSACWLMDADVANLYRGFATYGPANTAPAVSVTPVSVYGIAPVYTTGQTIQFTVAVDSTFPGWVSADVYDGAVKLGTVTNGGSNTISAVRPWGGRGVTAIARDAAGNERTSIPQPFVVSNAVALTNNATTTVGRTSADLSATFCPAWGSYTVTAYWGTVNGGSTAANWQNSAVVGTWTGGDATNVSYTATGLSEVTPHYFTFCASNSGSQVWASNVQSFTTVTPNAPTSSGASLIALEDTVTALAAGNFGYSDPLNVALAAVQITSLPALGTLKNGGVTVVNGDLPLTVLAANIGNLTYQSALNGNGTPYTTMGIKVMNAGNLWSAGATMTVNVTPVNDAPTSTGGSVNLNGNAVRTFSAGDFPFADVDASDTLGAIQVTTLPAQGTLKLNGSAITTVPSAVIPLANIGTLTYTAGPGYTVSDSFTFKVRDATLFSADATMTITGSSTFAVLTATNPTNSTTDYLTNTTGTITNTVTAAALNSLTIDTAAGNNIWDLTTGKTATITTGGLIMTGANNFTIQNGTLKSAATSALIVNQNGAGTLTLGSVIANGSGNSTLTKSGTGILTLSGTNTYSGATTISGGILYLTNALALQNSALDTTNSVAGSDTAGLKTNATTLTLGGLTGNKDLASVFTTALGGYSGVTALTLNPGTGVTNSYAGMISDGTVGMSLTKTGAGTQILSGTHTLTYATVNGGTLDITGGSLSLANGFVQVGSAVPGILKIDGGSLIVSSTDNNTGGLVAGGAAGNLGAIYLNSGAITTTIGFNLHIGGVGANSPTYGFLNITGGMLSGAQQRTRIGQYGGTGVWYQKGGTYSNTVASSSIEVGSAGTGGTNIGVVYLSGGTFTSSTVMNVATANVGIATLTVAGSAALTVNAGLTVGAASGTTATINLNGGTLTLNNSTVANAATGTINFNGGTLKAGLAGALFSVTNGSAYVYPGGATIDTQTNAVTISQALQAPAGSGVATIPVTSAGSGYIGAPYVALTGDGTGATAVANMVDDGTGNGTYKIGTITITAPGRGYTAVTDATLSGGLPGGGTAAVLNFASATFAANAGGGLTKIGSGTLTLTGTNTYTGDTKVSGGVLTVSGSSLADTGRLIIDGGKVNLTNAETVGTLFFGTTQQAAGTYSATGTNGTIASSNFTGTGTLIVTTGPAGGTPTITTSGTLSALSSTYGTASSPVSFTVAGATMTAGILVTAPTGFEVSQASGSGYGSTTTVGSAGTIATTTVYVRLAATAPVAGSYNSQNIVLSSSGAASVNVATAASGNSVSKAALTITANNQSKTYGTVQTTPVTGSAAFIASGLQNSETVGTVTLTYANGGLLATDAVGSTSTITPSAAAAGTFAAANYTIGYSSGTLTVVTSAAVITLTDTLGAVNTTYGTASATPTSFRVAGSGLTGNLTVTPPAGYEVSLSSGSGYSTSLSIPASGTLASTQVFVRLAATTAVNGGIGYTGNITVSGGSASSKTMATASSTVSKATPTVVVTPYSVAYDGNPHTATVTSITGVNGETGATVGTVALTTTHTNVGTYNTDSWTFTGAANYNSIGSTNSTITVANGSFETTGSALGGPWFTVGSPWSITSSPSNYQVIQAVAGGVFSSTVAGGGTYIGLINNDDCPITAPLVQNLGTSVTAGDTLSVTFYIGRALGATAGGAGVVYFDVAGTKYTMAFDTSTMTAGTWQLQTLTQTITNSGNLSLGFYGTTGHTINAWVDNISNVSRTSSGGAQTITNTINKATPTATLTVSNTPVTYDGTAKSATVGITTSSVPGAVQNVLTGGAATQTAAGTYAVTANFVPTDAANYSTLTAQSAGNFIINAVPTYTVSYNSNGGTGSQTDSSSPYNSGTTVTVLGAGTMARTGYAFTGWNTLAVGGGTSYSAGNTFTIAANVTLYAQWTASTITLADTLAAVNTTYGTASATPTSFHVSGSGLTGNLTVTPPAGYEVSLSSGSGYTTSLSITASGTLASTPVYVRLTSTTAINGGVGYTGNITVSGGGASSKTIATASSTVSKATPTVVVTPYSVAYDGNPHSATVTSITGVNGETGATVGTVALNTTHTTVGIYNTDSWTFTSTANYNNIGITTSSIPVINGNFETEYYSNTVATTNWVKLQNWNFDNTTTGSVSTTGAFTSAADPDGGSRFTFFTYNDAGAEQNLNTTVSAGDTLSVTFNLGVRLNPGGAWGTLDGSRVKGTAYFKVGSTTYSMPYDLTGQTAGVWYPFTFTTTITNSGALSLGFKNLNIANSYYTSLDGVSNISRTSSGGAQTITNTINKATPTATLAVNNSPVAFDNSPHAATVTLSANSVAGSVRNVLTGGAATQTAAATYAVTADFVPTDTTNYNTLTALSAGNFTITSGSGTSYTAWAAANGVTGGVSGDSNHDGLQNGIAYFMGVSGRATNPGLGASNTVTWPMSATFSGTFMVQTSPDLGTWTNVTPQPTRNGNGILVYTLPPGAGKLFVRLVVTPN